MKAVIKESEGVVIQATLISCPPPLTERYNNVSVLEGVAPGSQFTRIVATDADSGNFGEITYSIEGSSSVRCSCCRFMVAYKSLELNTGQSVRLGNM